MGMSENVYSMTGVDLLDVKKGDQPFFIHVVKHDKYAHAKSYIL